MPWRKTRADRQRDAKTYGSPEYQRNKAAAQRRAAGRCEQCRHRHPTQCDHVIPVSQGGSHTVANLQMLCHGPGTCQCHERKTAGEGGGYRQPREQRDPQPRPRTQW